MTYLNTHGVCHQ